MKRIERKPGYLFVEWSGAFPPVNEGIAFMQETAEICRRESFTKIIVDMNGIESEMKLLDGFKASTKGAELFRGLARVAIVNSRFRLAGFIETVGVNRGASLRIFEKLEEAEKWLEVEKYSGDQTS